MENSAYISYPVKRDSQTNAAAMEATQILLVGYQNNFEGDAHDFYKNVMVYTVRGAESNV